MAFGVAFLHPALALGAWVGVALLAAALCRSRGAVETFTACALFVFGAQVAGFWWTPPMTAVIFGAGGPRPVLISVAIMLLCGLSAGVVLGVVGVLVNRALTPRWWLPVGWMLGEVVRMDLTRISLSDWLATQWTVQPVLKALAHLGWEPTTFLCLFAAASVGEAWVERQRRHLVAPALVALAFVCLPRLDPGDLSVLEGVAVVHTDSTVDLPHRAPEGDTLELVIWPEAALDVQPRLAEGPVEGVTLPPLLFGSDADHLVGLVTHLPLVGRHNQAVALAADGTVRSSRAKRVLMLGAEEPLWGFGRERFERGRAPAVLQVGGRAVIAAICGEVLDRRLVAEGKASGGELLAVLARDWMMPDPIALRQLLAIQVLRSVEYAVPSVRASHGGWSTVVGADGRVLAASTGPVRRLLRWSPEAGAVEVDFQGRPLPREPSAAPPPQVAVLYSKEAPELRTRCPEGRCAHYALEDFACPGTPTPTVVVAGHGRPPTYLSVDAATVAAAAACFQPELIVIDACYGASSELLGALAPLDAELVAATSLIPLSGLHYGEAFFSDAPAAVRAAAVTLPGFAPLTRWHGDPEALAEALRTVEQLEASELAARLVRQRPPLIGVTLPGGGTVVAPIDRARVSDIPPAIRGR